MIPFDAFTEIRPREHDEDAECDHLFHVPCERMVMTIIKYQRTRRCEAWWDGVLVPSTPARLELGESVWTLPDSLKLPRVSQPHMLTVQLRVPLGP